jgi:transposase
VIERDLARSALADESVARLITIPGIDMVVALALVAAPSTQRFYLSFPVLRYGAGHAFSIA